MVRQRLRKRPVMTLDLVPIKRLEEAATPGPWRTDSDECCVYADEDASGTGDAIAERILTSADAAFIATSREAVPALIAEVERLTGYLTAILDHGSTMWSDSACGSGSAGGQTITSVAHGEVVQHLVQSALQGVSVKEAADAYAEWVPGTSRLDEPAKRPRRAGPDGRPV